MMTKPKHHRGEGYVMVEAVIGQPGAKFDAQTGKYWTSVYDPQLEKELIQEREMNFNNKKQTQNNQITSKPVTSIPEFECFGTDSGGYYAERNEAYKAPEPEVSTTPLIRVRKKGFFGRSIIEQV